MPIVAFMQNQWLHNAAKHQRRQDDLRASDLAQWWTHRRRAIPFALFRGCRSGRILTAALGQALCDHILWEEASTRIADNPRTVVPADPQHIRAVIQRRSPGCIVCFGKVAGDAVRTMQQLHGNFDLFAGRDVHFAPHPTARTINTKVEIGKLRAQLEALL
jgi:hypothetical protein